MTYRYERQFVDVVDEAGLGVVRIPSSGSGTSRDLPNLLVGRPYSALERLSYGGTTTIDLSDVWAIEHKYTSAAQIYLDAEEVEALIRFARRFGADPYAAARFSQDTNHYLIPIDDLRQTRGGNYAVDRDGAEDVARHIVDATEAEVRMDVS